MMISLLTMVIKAVTTAFLYIVKAFFSIVLWFAKLFARVLKMFFVILPVTAIVFVALFILNVFLLITGSPAPGQIAASIAGEAGQMASSLLSKNALNLSAIFSQLISWWKTTLDSYAGNGTYYILIVLTVLMFLPVCSVLLIISVFSSFWILLFFAIVADAVLYVLRAIIGQSFLSQIRGRMHRLFPKTGVKYEEREYARNLKQRNREMREEAREKSRHKYDEYYEEVEPEEDGYYEDDFYEDEFYEDEDYEDEEFEEEYGDEYEEEDWDEDEPAPVPAPATSFDFFAGCNSRESVDRKYKSLVKLYHPDNMDGDTAALQEINVQYTEAKKRFS